MMRYSWLVVLTLFLTACAGANSETQGAPPSTQPAAAVPTTAAETAPAATTPADTPTTAPTETATLPPATATFTVEPTATEPVQAAALPDPAAFTWRPVVSGLASPVGMGAPGDGSGRLFILEQAGRIRIVQNGTVLPEPFLDIVPQVNSNGNEQGLLGLDFHPRYSENGFFYVNYTRTDGDTVIARFQVSADDPHRADPASEKQLLLVPQPYANHNGGAVEFGPDGYLYLGLGDGGAANDPQGNGQSLETHLGKILRIDVDGGDPYAIPADNPFASGGGLPEIWAYGLRNPWRFSFDRLTGDLYIGDVGQNQWEEIHHLPGGAAGGVNFGWDFFEGSHPFEGTLPSGTTVVAPVAEYSHAEGGCSVTGGPVYRGQQLPEWQGVYLYGDFCTGNVWGLLPAADGSWQSGLLYQNVGRITSFGEDDAGEVYLIDRSGIVYVLARP